MMDMYRAVEICRKFGAPFPWYGGKRRRADEMWARFGKPKRYLEPFGGSIACLLHRPLSSFSRSSDPGIEIVTDINGGIANFYRAVKTDPEKVIHYAAYPTIHQDLTARHKWLIKWLSKKSHKLSEDPEFYNAKAAGWWVWGISIWIGAGWCNTSTRIPNQQQLNGRAPRVDPKNTGQGVSMQRKSVDIIPAIDVRNGGMGISQQQRSTQKGFTVAEWIEAISVRLHRVIVLNRSWTSCTSPSILGDTPSNPQSDEIAILLDPPYSTEDRTSVYANNDNGNLAKDAYEWAIENGERYRIAYCGYSDDFPVPDGWEFVDNTLPEEQRKFKRGKKQIRLDRIMYSPACRSIHGISIFEN